MQPIVTATINGTTHTITPIHPDDLQYMEGVYTERWGKLEREYSRNDVPAGHLAWWCEQDQRVVTLSNYAVAREATRRSIRRSMERLTDIAMVAAGF